MLLEYARIVFLTNLKELPVRAQNMVKQAVLVKIKQAQQG